jgi:hypothetical protein
VGVECAWQTARVCVRACVFMWVPTYPSLISCRSILLLGKATGDPAYTRLGDLAAACNLAKRRPGDYKQSKEKKAYDAYATSLRRALVWEVSC